MNAMRKAGGSSYWALFRYGAYSLYSDGEATVQPLCPVGRYGYLLLMQPESEIVVRPRIGLQAGAPGRRLVFCNGTLDLIARDLESIMPIEIASIEA